MAVYSISNHVGQEVIRYAFLIKHNSDFYNLFTVFEHMFPDMGDYCSFPKIDGKSFCECVEKVSGKDDKVFLSVDRVILSDNMVRTPWEDILIDRYRIDGNTDNYKWATGDYRSAFILPLHDERIPHYELIDMLPKRRSSAFVNYCIPSEIDKCPVIKRAIEDKELVSQIQSLSLEHLGYDLSVHTKFYGGYVFVAHNPYYYNIDLTEDSNRKGLYCRVCYRPEVREPLTFRITLYSIEHQVLCKVTRRNVNCEFLSHFDFDTAFNVLDIDVYDSSDILIDTYKDVSFIHSFKVDVEVAEKKVAYIDESGNKRIVEKYSSEYSDSVDTKEIQTLFDSSAEYAHEKFEKSLDFVFFDGDKETKMDNRKKAIDCILRILDSTRRVCYICDMFFDRKAFVDFVIPVRKLDLDIRILSSKERNSSDELRELKEIIEKHNNEVGTKISSRVMRGTAALHDRLIVSDDRVWMLGCSLNEYGVRATTLIRVPQAYASKIIGTVETWWKNEEISENL